MEEKHLIAVERWTFGLALLLVAIAALLLNRRAAFSLSVGAGLMSLNAWALRRISARAFKSFKRPGAAVLLFNLKMGVLMLLVYLALRYLHVDPISFIVGISIFPVAILAVALRHATRAHDSEETHG